MSPLTTYEQVIVMIMSFFLQACKEFASSPTQWILSLLWMLFFIQQQLRQHQGLFFVYQE
jgi:hypothetical protein